MDDGDSENEGEGKSKSGNLRVDSESVASLSAKTLNVNLKHSHRHVAEVSDEKSEEDTPVLVNHELPNLVSVLETADVVLQVLDARDPLSFRSKHVEDFAKEKNKKLLFVLNKIGGRFPLSLFELDLSDFLVPWQIDVQGRLSLIGSVTCGRNSLHFYSDLLRPSLWKSRHSTSSRKRSRSRARQDIPLLMRLALIR